MWFPAYFRDHPLISRLSDAAFRLWASSIEYCSRNLTDGFVPREIVAGLVGHRVRKKVLEELLRPIPPYGVLWELDPRGIGYLVHDYLKWNPSRAEVQCAEDEVRDELPFYDEERPLGRSRQGVAR